MIQNVCGGHASICHHVPHISLPHSASGLSRVWQSAISSWATWTHCLSSTPSSCLLWHGSQAQAGWGGQCSLIPREKGALNLPSSPGFPDVCVENASTHTTGSTQSSVEKNGKEKGNGIKTLLRRNRTQSSLVPICLKLRLKMWWENMATWVVYGLS